MRTLYNNITRKMLWWLVVPTSLLILSLSVLVAIYTSLIFKSNNISVKFSGVEVVAIINQTDDIMKKADEVIETLAAICPISIYSARTLLNHQAQKSTKHFRGFSKENLIKIVPEASSKFKELENLRKQINEQRSNLQKLKNDITQLHRK